MIVYVESNFVLELAFLRDDHTSAQRILAHGEAKRIRLLMPAFCGGEPYESMIRRAKDRRALQSRLDQEIRELSRSQPYIDIGTVSQDLTSILAKSADEEKIRLDAALMRIIEAAEIIPLDGLALRQSLDFQVNLGLSPQDAIVFASIMAHLEAAPLDEPKVLITKNAKDFLIPDIIDLLTPANCKLLTRFSDGVGYIESAITLPN
jgi:predicted nucleic acid-binding protein